MLLAAPFCIAQTAATPQTAPPAHKAAHQKARSAKTHNNAAQEAVSPAAAPEAPKEPEAPKWPVNDEAVQASVVWDSHGLSIAATNSSLQQILKDVQTATGAEVDGMGADERVFGIYGPGLARDVLTQLLHGSGYNVLMVGDLGKGAPRQIVLSARNAGDAQAANKPGTSNGDEEAAENDAEEQPQQPAPQPVRPGFGPGGPPRTPQQIMQEMQQRQLGGRNPNPQ